MKRKAKVNYHLKAICRQTESSLYFKILFAGFLDDLGITKN